MDCEYSFGIDKKVDGKLCSSELEQESIMKYFSNLDSIRSHPLPKWYDDCKLGIFIHWGL